MLTVRIFFLYHTMRFGLHRKKKKRNVPNFIKSMIFYTELRLVH